MATRNLSSWLPGLIGPVAVNVNGGDVTPRGTWAFTGGISASSDETTDTITFALGDFEFDSLRIYNPAGTFYYTIQGSAIVANRVLSLPVLAGDDTVACLAATQTLTNKTISGASNTLTVRLASDVTGTLPVANGGTGLTAVGTGLQYLRTNAGATAMEWASLPTFPAGTIVGTSDSQTLTNKTISGASNTLTVRLASDVTGTLPVANGGTGVTSLTLPASGLVVGTTDTQTLTNKTLTSPTLGGTVTYSATSMQATGNTRAKTYSDIGNVQTTDATVTTIFSWSIIDEAVTVVTAEIAAVKSDGSVTASYVRRARIKRDGGTVTVGTVTDVSTDEEAGFSTCDVTIDASGSTGRVRVTGQLATTIDWGAVVTRLEVTHA